MLVFTRRIGESFMIGDDIKVTVLKTVNGNVRVGIDAPESVSIHREEIFKRIQEEKKGKSK